MTAQSSLQSNWKASPGAKVSGTKVPRPVVCSASCWRLPPLAGKGGHPVVGTRVAQRHQVCVHLLQVSPLLARLTRLGLEPDRQLVGEGIELARAAALRIPRFHHPRRADTCGSCCETARYAGQSPGWTAASRRCQRLITLNNATSITPTAPCRIKQQVRVLTWIRFAWKLPGLVDHFWVEINSGSLASTPCLCLQLQQTRPVGRCQV